MFHTALASCTGSLQFPTTDDLALSLKSYVSPPSLRKRRYTFQRMSHRSHSTLNFLPMTMINYSRYTPRHSLMITAIPIQTAAPLLLANHNRPQFRKRMKEQRATPTLPAPLRTSNISMTTIITTTILAMSTIATMATITIGSVHHLPLIGVRPTGHPRLRMYTPMVIEIMIYFMHLTQVLYRLKVFYTAAFDPLAVQQPPKGERRLAGPTSMVSTESKMPTGKPAWRILRVSRDFQNVIA